MATDIVFENKKKYEQLLLDSSLVFIKLKKKLVVSKGCGFCALQ